MRMLERSFTVSTRFGAGSSSRSTASRGRRPQRLVLLRERIQAPVGARARRCTRATGLVDLHDWTATDSVPAVVGSYPEPFLHGTGGKRLPTTIECASDVTAACTVVQAELLKQG